MAAIAPADNVAATSGRRDVVSWWIVSFAFVLGLFIGTAWGWWMVRRIARSSRAIALAAAADRRARSDAEHRLANLRKAWGRR